jgi:tRNA G18 (ribose-2'-O)-methylase SpoU
MKSPIEMIRIESISDPRVEDYRDIRDRDLIGPDGRRGLFIGETVLVVEVMLGIPGMTRSVLASEQQADRLAEMIAGSASPDTPLLVASRESIESIAGFDIHRGVIACGHRQTCSTRSLSNIIPPLGREATVLICEKINNIDNIGMLFRNAAAFGVDGVVLSPDCHDPLYRKSLRTSIGHALRIPFHRSIEWTGTLDQLREDHDLELVGTSLGRDALPLDEIEKPHRIGLLIGSEFDGLSPDALARCRHLARIPMAPGTDSLNVGVAAAVCLHHFSQAQRR